MREAPKGTNFVNKPTVPANNFHAKVHAVFPPIVAPGAWTYFREGAIHLEISKHQISVYILHEIRVNTMLKQYLMLIKFMLSVLLIKLVCFK